MSRFLAESTRFWRRTQHSFWIDNFETNGLPYVCRKFNIRVVFKSGRTLRSMLTKVKDTLPLGKQSNVVYRIPCSCGQVYIGETRRRLETRLEGTPGCLREGDDGDVSCRGAYVGESPPNPLGGDHSVGPLQRTGTVGEGGPAHPDDTLIRAFQPRWRTGSPWLLDHCDEEAGREEKSSPTFDLQ